MVGVVGICNASQSTLAFLVGDVDAQKLMYGQLAILAVLVLSVAAIFAFTEKRVTSVVVSVLNDPESPFGKHRIDPAAHPQMREAMSTRLEQKLDQINASIRSVEREHRDSLAKIGETIVKPIVDQNNRTLSLLEKQMDRQRRFEDGPRGEDKS